MTMKEKKKKHFVGLALIIYKYLRNLNRFSVTNEAKVVKKVPR